MTRVMALSLICALSGCAHRYVYENSALAPSETDRVFAVDNGYCDLVVRGLERPVAPVADACPPDAQYNCPAGAYAGAAAQNVGNNISAARDKADIYKSCMASRGWTRRRIR